MEMYGPRVGHSPRGARGRKAPQQNRLDRGPPPSAAPVAAALSVCFCGADSDKRDAQGLQNNKQTLPHFPNVGEGRHKGGAIPLVAGLNAAEVKAGGGARATPPVVPTQCGVRCGGEGEGVAAARLFCFPLNCHKRSFP